MLSGSLPSGPAAGTVQVPMGVSVSRSHRRNGMLSALVLEKGLADDILEPDLDNYRLLADAWIAAREPERAYQRADLVGPDPTVTAHQRAGRSTHCLYALRRVHRHRRCVAPLKRLPRAG